MKRYTIPVILLFILAISCKKTKSPVYTSMTLYVNGDSSWTATDVTTNMQSTGSSVIITGKDKDSAQTVTFILVNFREGRKTYQVGSGSVPGYNYGSAASYDYSGYRVDAYGGFIDITNFTQHTMDGTFDLNTNKGEISGHFSAPLP